MWSANRRRYTRDRPGYGIVHSITFFVDHDECTDLGPTSVLPLLSKRGALNVHVLISLLGLVGIHIDPLGLGFV